jgi:peptidoglycan/xylan/chitin deacetylase (PgdA/CDA1 family)
MKRLCTFGILFSIVFFACSCAPAGNQAVEPVVVSSSAGIGAIKFVINVHDWVNLDDSAATLLHLVDLFEKYGVKGDSYFTASVVEAYVTHHPEVIDRLKASSMTISYHIRPPHPLYTGFDSRLKGLVDDALYQTIMDYETYALDLETGDLDRTRPGGYWYVAQVFGTKPVSAAAPNMDPHIKRIAEKVYANLGAEMTIHYHEGGTDLDRPYVYSNGLLVRPSDFSITRVPGSQDFWWNFMSGPHAAEYDPAALLETRLSEWQADRPPLITALIHENNFYRSGPESWTSYYFTGGDKNGPQKPPFNLDAPVLSNPRTESEQQAIWNAYERLVAFAAARLNVITSADVLIMAKGEKK